MNQDVKKVYDLCKAHIHSYVLAEMNDGSKIDGIITGLDDEYVYMAVPFDQEQDVSQQMNHHNRQFGYPGFGGFPGYSYPPRRFNRLILPLAALVALTALPWY
ncbi:hypothetical protein DX933_06005 [Ornithinibacillus gellani]|uniref:hypothetical protein n=1 Tax=Ornithinibacillus gellani TaxID=2293253 RepID=UPI000F482AE3|nr:hypothetical protein [Ornithinibacillus gellani]TQS75820.1 hypothetical protein DX933_06005 [Ornithinibacillus gellani]